MAVISGQARPAILQINVHNQCLKLHQAGSKTTAPQPNVARPTIGVRFGVRCAYQRIYGLHRDWALALLASNSICNLAAMREVNCNLLLGACGSVEMDCNSSYSFACNLQHATCANLQLQRKLQSRLGMQLVMQLGC